MTPSCTFAFDSLSRTCRTCRYTRKSRPNQTMCLHMARQWEVVVGIRPRSRSNNLHYTPYDYMFRNKSFSEMCTQQLDIGLAELRGRYKISEPQNFSNIMLDILCVESIASVFEKICPITELILIPSLRLTHVHGQVETLRHVRVCVIIPHMPHVSLHAPSVQFEYCGVHSKVFTLFRFLPKNSYGNIRFRKRTTRIQSFAE